MRWKSLRVREIQVLCSFELYFPLKTSHWIRQFQFLCLEIREHEKVGCFVGPRNVAFSALIQPPDED